MSDTLEQQRLKSAIWYTVGKIVQDEQTALGVQATPQFIAALSDLVFEKAQSLGVDLEAFMKHAGRQTLNMEDVKLCARRNDGLYDLISEKAEQLSTSKQTKSAKR